MALTAHGLAATLVGSQFAEQVARITPWMAVGAGLYGFRANYLDHAFQLGKRAGLQVWVSLVAAVIATGLSVWLIPRIGPVGAAIAITVAMSVSCLHAWYLGQHAYKVPLPTGQLVRIGVACLAMTVVVLLVPGAGPASFAAQVVLGGIAYVVVDVMGSRDRLRAPIRRARERWLGKPDLNTAGE
jgi:O-antigen/teichoic acid export membrane protein